MLDLRESDFKAAIIHIVKELKVTITKVKKL